MLKNSIPEIQRCNLTNVVLQLLALKIDPLTFNFLDKPPKEVSGGGGGGGGSSSGTTIVVASAQNESIIGYHVSESPVSLHILLLFGLHFRLYALHYLLQVYCISV
jgi:hypothetical protein